MNKIVSFVNKPKLLILAMFCIFFLCAISLQFRDAASGVESYKFTKNYTSTSVGVRSIDRAASPFKFLLVDAGKAPFTITLNLGKRPKRGIRSLWLYAAQAHNHGQIYIEYKGALIGSVNNLLSEKVHEPIPKLSYVGDIDIDDSDVVLNVTGTSENSNQHYSELGLIVLSPLNMTEREVLNVLDGKNGSPGFNGGNGGLPDDVGIVIIILILGYISLAFLNKGARQNTQQRPKNIYLSIAILVAIVTYTSILSIGSYSPPIISGYLSTRAGLEKIVDIGLKGGLDFVDRFQGNFLPNHQQNDDVPKRLQNSSGKFKTYIYKTDIKTDFQRVSKNIFFGNLNNIQLLPAYDFGIILLSTLFLIFLSICLDRFIPGRFFFIAALSLICGLSVTISMRLSEGWDEFFINLRHAYMLLHHGNYSINSKNMVEATVDLIPLLLTASGGWIGLDLVDSFILASLLGNILVISFSFLIAHKLTQSRTWALVVALLVGLYPNVLWVGGTGFSAVLFSGCILGASYFAIFTNRRWVGLAFLATLTLIRTEGILFALIIVFYINIFSPVKNLWNVSSRIYIIKNFVIDVCLVSFPFLCSLVVRKILYGKTLPNPITFKNTGFDSAYFSSGLYRFGEMVSNHDIHLIFLLTCALFIANFRLCKGNEKFEPWKIDLKKLLALNLAISLFIFPYYLGGGDWFSVRWNRYGLPYNLVLVITFMVLIYGAFYYAMKGWIRRISLVVFCFALIVGYHESAHFRKDNFIYSTLPTVIHPFGERWLRIDNLASLGQFLRDTLPIDAVVSSPEEATVMYFSEREMLGLLGVSTPEIADMPFQPMNPGDILHRRRAYESVYRNRPDVIALYEPVTLVNFDLNKHATDELIKTLESKFFNQKMVDIAYYRIGSFSALEKMGYRHITIVLTDRIFSLFVSARIYNQFIKNIEGRGLTYSGSGFINYSVNPDLSSRYLPADIKFKSFFSDGGNDANSGSSWMLEKR